MKKLLLILTMFTALKNGHGQSAKTMSETEKMMDECDRRVFYEIFIRSFYDSNGDGIGDINGITEKLDYLQQLGIGGIWITPIHPAPSYHKYDVTDYKNIDPQYGTLDDFKRLVKEAHKRNIYVMMDLVVNHTSHKHPWFVASIHNDPHYRNYYVWDKDPAPVKEGGWYVPVDEKGNKLGDEKYYAFFWRGMPDLNYDDPDVRREIIDIGKFWLQETGIDGFRLDAAQYIYDPLMPEKNAAWWKEFTDSLKKVNPQLITIGECWNDYTYVAQYLPALSGVFNFELSWAILKSLRAEQDESVPLLIDSIKTEYEKHTSEFIDPIFLSNHDVNRIRSDLKNNPAKAKLAACIYLTLPGTPFVYYGEELGMLGAKPDSLIREPFPWTNNTGDKGYAGWEKPYYSTLEAVAPLTEQMNDPSSFYTLYKKLIALRLNNPALTSREFEAVAVSDSSLLAYKRGSPGNYLLVIHNLSGKTVSYQSSEIHAYPPFLFSSDENIRAGKNEISLPPYSTVIIQLK